MSIQSVTTPKEIIDFYENLNRLHEKYSVNAGSLKLSPAQKENSLEQKAPMLNFVPLELKGEKVSQVFDEVCQVICLHRPQLKNEVAKIQSIVNQDNISQILEKFLWQEKGFLMDFVEKIELKEEIFTLILFNTLKPFARIYGNQLKEELSPLWQESYCPVCGWQPVFAVNSPNQPKHLHCSLCDTQWTFKNLKCTHCHNEDHQSLKYFRAENIEAYQVNACEKCHGYIKTVNEGKLINKESAFMTDLRTIYLDILAEQEGYKKEVTLVSPEDKN